MYKIESINGGGDTTMSHSSRDSQVGLPTDIQSHLREIIATMTDEGEGVFARLGGRYVQLGVKDNVVCILGERGYIAIPGMAPDDQKRLLKQFRSLGDNK